MNAWGLDPETAKALSQLLSWAITCCPMIILIIIGAIATYPREG